MERVLWVANRWLLFPWEMKQVVRDGVLMHSKAVPKSVACSQRTYDILMVWPAALLTTPFWARDPNVGGSQGGRLS